DLREQRVHADDARRQNDAAQQRRPVGRDRTRECHRGREHAAVGEQPARVLEAVVRLHHHTTDSAVNAANANSSATAQPPQARSRGGPSTATAATTSPEPKLNAISTVVVSLRL